MPEFDLVGVGLNATDTLIIVPKFPEYAGKAAFARDPRAFEGWKRMSPSHRRGHLLGIFGYRTPEARDRRIVKMLEEAVARGEKTPRAKSD